MDALIKSLRPGKAPDGRPSDIKPSDAKQPESKIPESRPAELDPSEFLAAAVRADRGGQKFGWVQLGRAAFRNLRFRLFCVRRLDIRRPAVRSFAWAEGFDQCVHVNSVRPVSNGPECHRQTGRPGRRTPESHNPNT